MMNIMNLYYVTNGYIGCGEVGISVLAKVVVSDYETLVKVKVQGKDYAFTEMSKLRSDYRGTFRDYFITNVCEYVPDTRYHVNYTFPNKEVAKHFVEFMECSGESLMKDDSTS